MSDTDRKKFEAELAATDGPAGRMKVLTETEQGRTLLASLPVEIGIGIALTIGYGSRINTPSPRKVTIDMVEVISGHTTTGSRYITSGIKTAFPDTMNEVGIERAVRNAYANSSQIGSPQGERVMLGESHGLTIEMWYNRTTRTIETAYPK